MKVLDTEYYQSGIERMRQARELHLAGRNYALAMYTGGLAVECILRAYRWGKEPSFDGRHDLDNLLTASDLYNINEEVLRSRNTPFEEIQALAFGVKAAMSELTILWHNNLRFVSEAGLRPYLRQVGRLQGIKGDPLKKNSSDLINAAQTVVNRGVALWTLRKKSPKH